MTAANNKKKKALCKKNKEKLKAYLIKHNADTGNIQQDTKGV